MQKKIKNLIDTEPVCCSVEVPAKNSISSHLFGRVKPKPHFHDRKEGSVALPFWTEAQSSKISTAVIK